MDKKIIALVGNPNVGKTTLFNTIANAEEHVGNWHGVTVEYKEKELLSNNGEHFILTDLPGTYSLSSYSYEEAVTRDYLQVHNDIKIINICDANNLERNLLLTLELIEMGLNPILCINMANDLKRTGKQIDIDKMQNLLGIKVFLINAQKRQQVKEVVAFALIDNNKYQMKTLAYIDTISQKFDKLDLGHFFKIGLSQYQKIKVLEQDEYCLEQFSISPDAKNKVVQICELEKTLEYVLENKFSFIDKIANNFVSFSKEQKVYGYSKFDKIVLNRWLSIPVFLFVIGLIFYLTFGGFGTMLAESLSSFFDRIVFFPLTNWLGKLTHNMFVYNFITKALFGSILSLVSFLPQIVLMFLGLYILEDSGYMSRLAFSLEDFFKKVGLSGKSVFTLLMGLGCGTTASLTSRDMEDKNSKIKTAILTPYISCSAKLPLYAVVTGAFFPQHKFLIVCALYLLGLFVALIVSYALNKTVLPSASQSFIMELPRYRIPSAKKIIKNILINVKQFLIRVGSILLTFSSIVWLLENCNFKFEYQVGDSILKSISQFLSPIFIPLGFGNYGAVACLLCGFVAKEIIVSTISLINGVGGANDLNAISASLVSAVSVFSLTKASSLSFLVFALLYLPCLSSVSVFIREIGAKWTFFACIIEFAISYLLALITFKISTYFFVNGACSGILSLIVFVGISFAIVLAYKLVSKKKVCKHCPNNKYCNRQNNC